MSLLGISDIIIWNKQNKPEAYLWNVLYVDSIFRSVVMYFNLFSQFRLETHYGIFSYDNKYQWWDEFPLDNVVSATVTIEVVSVHTQFNNGFIEVEFYVGQSE